MKNLTNILTFIVLATLASCNNSGSTKEINNDSKTIKDTTLTVPDTTQTAGIYQCPMDCEKGKTYSKPGQCPVCGMNLEKK